MRLALCPHLQLPTRPNVGASARCRLSDVAPQEIITMVSAATTDIKRGCPLTTRGKVREPAKKPSLFGSQSNLPALLWHGAWAQRLP